MKGKFIRMCSILAASAALSYGCGEAAAPLAPEQPAHGLVGDVLGTVTEVLTPVTVLQRTSPLAADIVRSADIGKDGGAIEIKEAGIKVIFPKNALTPPKSKRAVTITVTALKGEQVAYTFEPHGITFREPVRIEQEFKGTNAEKNKALIAGLEGAYFPSVNYLDPLRGVANVLEFRPTSMDVTGSKVKFTVDHFSGYLIASGRYR
jgi:hypothetical protein